MSGAPPSLASPMALTAAGEEPRPPLRTAIVGFPLSRPAGPRELPASSGILRSWRASNPKHAKMGFE